MKGKKAKPVEEPSAVPESNWEAGLVAAPLVEEGWQACVTLVVGERIADDVHIKALLQAVRQPQRRLFCAITWENMIEKINELGNPRGRKPKDVPLFYEVTEPAKVILDAKEELPCQLLGKLLKFLLLVAKGNSMQHMGATEHKAADDQAREKDKSGASVKPPAKVEKAKKAPEPHTPMKETKLKRRGEEEEVRKFIDDEPDDGPQLYVLLVGFHQLQLFPILDSLGVHVSAVLRLGSEAVEVQEGSESPENEALEAQKRKRQEGLDTFWKFLEPVLNSGPARSKLFDVARLRYIVKKDLVPLDMEDSKIVLAFGSRIFEDVACLIYNCLDWRKQHLHYLDSMRLVPVPSVAKVTAPTPKKKPIPGEAAPSAPEPLGSTYRTLLDTIPPEALSVSLILHCVLEQVVASQEEVLASCMDRQDRSLEKHPPRDSAPSAARGTTRLSDPQGFPTAERMMGDSGAVKHPEEESKAVEPLLLGYHDERSRRLHHLSVCHGFDPMKAEVDMQKNTRVFDLLRSVRPPTENTARLARVQELCYFCADESLCWALVERAFSQLELESIALTETDQSGRLATAGPTDSGPNPWDDPVSFAKLFLSQQQEQQEPQEQDRGPHDDSPGASEANQPVRMSVEAIQKARRRSLTAWHFAERHSAAVFPQVLGNASQAFRCMDTYRRCYDNSMLVVCHNPMGPQRQSTESWDVALHTDVGFRKYLEHVADSISDWVQQEEAKWRAPRDKREPSEHSDRGREEGAEKKGSPSPKRMTASPAMSVDESTKESYIRKDSLKAWKMEQDKLKEDDSANKAKKDKAGKASGKGERSESSEDRKKTPSPTKRSREDLLHTLEEPPPAEEAFTGFTGYCMDGALVQIRGETHYLFPSDGGLVRVERTHFVEGSTLVRVRVTKDRHQFFTHISDPEEDVGQDGNRSAGAGGQKGGVSRGGSFSALLHGGIRLAYSRHGPSGESRDARDGELTAEMEKLLAAAPAHEGPAPLSPSSTAKRGKPSNSPKSSQGKLGPTAPVSPAPPVPSVSPAPPVEGDPAAESTEQAVPPEGSSTKQERPPFQTLGVSTPSGLLLQFLHEELTGVTGRSGGLLVRQRFPHCRGRERTVTSQGTVVKCLGDGCTEILFADGTVSCSPYSGPVSQPPTTPPTREAEPKREKTQEVMDSVDNKGKTVPKQSAAVEPKTRTGPRALQDLKAGAEQTPQPRMDNWVTTAPSGFRVATVAERVETVQPVQASKATDPTSGTVVVTREDGVFIMMESDGTVTAEHSDGTRITTRYEDAEEPAIPECLDTGKDPLAGTRTVKEVLVECEDFATVVMSFTEETCTATFGDGTVVSATSRGSYQVLPSSGGLLHIEEDGSASYTSRPDRSAMLPPGGEQPTAPRSSYVMRHTSSVVCEVTDSEGNLFQVTMDGKTNVVLANPDDVTAESSEEEVEDEELQEEEDEAVEEAGVGHVEEEEGHMEDGETPELPHVIQKDQPARFFIAHADGSGTELLRLQDVEGFLSMAEIEPSTAVLKESFPDLPGVLGITVLRPCPKDIASCWIVPKQKPDVVPAVFKSRKWEKLPPSEVPVSLAAQSAVTPCPPTNTSLGRGLRSSEGPQHHTPPPLLCCPEALEVRLLVQYEPISSELRRTLEDRLKEYMDHVLRREFLWQEMQLKDPRSEEEKCRAAKLLQRFRSQLCPDHPSDSLEKRISGGDVGGLYTQVLQPSSDSPDESVPDESLARSSVEERESQWPAALEQYREELREGSCCRESLRNKLIPPYFLSDFANAVRHTQEVPDMRSLSQALPPFPRTGQNAEIQHFLRDATPKTRSDPMAEGKPTSPVPPVSTLAGSSVPSMRCGSQDRQKQWGPPHSTPGHRTSTPGNRTQDLKGTRRVGARPHGAPLDSEEALQKVTFPSSVLSSKPRSVPNERFLSVEEPVRRKVRTVSVAGTRMGSLRGFELHPTEVRFGVLKEGCTYCVPVVLRNIGIDSCRFHVKQPPPATGLRVVYNPGPVAAGMQTHLQVELFAMASELQDGTAEGHLSLDVQILTETEIIFLPVFATVLPEALYDSRALERSPPDRAGGTRVRIVSSTPTVGRGVLRPTKLPTASDGQ